MGKVVTILTHRLLMEEVVMEDLTQIHHLHSTKEVDEFNTLGIPKNRDVTKALIIEIIENQKVDPQQQYHLKVCLSKSNEFVGMAGISLSRDKYNIGEIYYKLLPQFWGKGFATEIATNLLEYGFKVFKLHKIEAGVATENVQSIRILEKIGMTREGLRRKILPIRGKWKDNYHYGILDEDPRPPQNSSG